MRRATRIVRPVAGAILLAVSGCASADLGPEYVPISEEESGIVFYGPGMENGYRQFLSGTTAEYTRQTFAIFGPPKGRYPHATIIFMETPPNYHFTVVDPPSETIATWGEFDGKRITVGKTGFAVNKIGRIDYALFTADDLACVNWRQDFGAPIERGFGTQLFIGYYCRTGGSMMSAGEAKSILRRIGHRKFGVPDAPPGWADGARLEDPHVRLLVFWEAGVSGGDNVYRGILGLGDESTYTHVVAEDGQTCSGTFDSGAARGGSGPWALTCSNGRIAEGVFRITGAEGAGRRGPATLTLAGTGTDAVGNGVVLVNE